MEKDTKGDEIGMHSENYREKKPDVFPMQKTSKVQKCLIKTLK